MAFHVLSRVSSLRGLDTRSALLPSGLGLAAFRPNRADDSGFSLLFVRSANGATSFSASTSAFVTLRCGVHADLEIRKSSSSSSTSGAGAGTGAGAILTTGTGSGTGTAIAMATAGAVTSIGIARAGAGTGTGSVPTAAWEPDARLVWNREDAAMEMMMALMTRYR